MYKTKVLISNYSLESRSHMSIVLEESNVISSYDVWNENDSWSLIQFKKKDVDKSNCSGDIRSCITNTIEWGK